MAHEKLFLSLAQVRTAERPALATTDDISWPDVRYDGIVFLKLAQGGVWVAATDEELPATGWWHRDGCNCWFCRRARSASLRHPGFGCPRRPLTSAARGARRP